MKKGVDENRPIIQIIGAEELEKEETHRRREDGPKMNQTK